MKTADLEQLFYKATGMKFRVEQASSFTPAADLVYFLDDYLYGQYWEQVIEAGSLDPALSLTLAGMQASCSGRAVSGRVPGRENDLAKLRRGFVTSSSLDAAALAERGRRGSRRQLRALTGQVAKGSPPTRRHL